MSITSEEIQSFRVMINKKDKRARFHGHVRGWR